MYVLCCAILLCLMLCEPLALPSHWSILSFLFFLWCRLIVVADWGAEPCKIEVFLWSDACMPVCVYVCLSSFTLSVYVCVDTFIFQFFYHTLSLPGLPWPSLSSLRLPRLVLPCLVLFFSFMSHTILPYNRRLILLLKWWSLSHSLSLTHSNLHHLQFHRHIWIFCNVIIRYIFHFYVFRHRKFYYFYKLTDWLIDSFFIIRGKWAFYFPTSPNSSMWTIHVFILI